jgi:amino acid adenylation domain-containing protein
MQTLTSHSPSAAEQISGLRDRYPDSIALSYGDKQLTYDELDRKAAKFAGYLVQCGVVPGGTVAICMERSFDWIVAALGIMYAGAAYVPLDSAWPNSRLRFAVKDSGATVLVGRAALLDRLRAKAYSVDPCRDAAAISAAPTEARRPVQSQSLAYVIYTSGSTGVPKGVEITHGNLSHLIDWHRDAFRVRQEDRASHLAGLGFDAAVWEIWPHLAAGATVCLASDAVRSSPVLLQQWIIRERVTIAFVPTVYATSMVAMEWPPATSLRVLLTGGDVLHRAPSVGLPFEVVNNYGPTECTVVATSAPIKSGSKGVPPIGRPISGAILYLLNEDGEPVPDGDTGEIYIGGSGVGRGYRNLLDCTKRSFLPDPFSGVLGARMYRTGDRGARRGDGEIEFRGRVDRQTKIRGQRVELDEIGSILSRHPSVAFATAITHSAQEAENQLVAYVLPKKSSCIPTVHELQEHLLRSLPDYMIPDIFVRLHALPLSTNGKVDFTLLEPPDDANLLESTASQMPAAPTKVRLLTIVQALLENDAVRVDDSFFLAGGHSLLGMQLVMRVRVAFGVDLTLRQLFEAPTVDRLALLIDEKLQEDRPSLRVTPDLPPGVYPLQPDGTRNPIFWVYYLSPELANVIGNDQPLLCVVPTAEDFSSLGEKPTLQSFAACLVRKIQSTQPKGPYTIGGLCLGGILAYEIANQMRAAGHDVSLVVMVDSPNPSYVQSCHTLASKVRYVSYALKRAVRLGLRQSLFHLREHIIERPAIKVALEAAAFAYKPERYDGKVLLVLASEHPPHKNFLPGWQAVVSRNLHAQYVEGHRNDLLVKNVRTVADAIIFHHGSALGGESAACRLDIPKSPAPSANLDPETVSIRSTPRNHGSIGQNPILLGADASQARPTSNKISEIARRTYPPRNSPVGAVRTIQTESAGKE